MSKSSSSSTSTSLSSSSFLVSTAAIVTTKESSSTTTTTTARTTTSTTPIIVEEQVPVWRCDVCHLAIFQDYKEACRHEEECRKLQLDKQQEQQKLPTTTTTAVAACTMTTTNMDASTIAEGGRSIMSHPSRNSRCYSSVETKSSSTRGVSPDSSPPKDISKRTKKRSKPQRLPSSSSSSNIQNNKTVQTFFAPRTKPTTTTTTTTTTTMTPSLSSSQWKVSTATTTDDDDDDDDEVIEVDPVLGRPPPVLSTGSGVPRNMNAKRLKTSSSSISSSKKASTSTVEMVALASIFQKNTTHSNNDNNLNGTIQTTKSMQQLMAEHKQAEFQAERRLQRQKEIERQQRRIATVEFLKKEKMEKQEEKKKRKEKTNVMAAALIVTSSSSTLSSKDNTTSLIDRNHPEMMIIDPDMESSDSKYTDTASSSSSCFSLPLHCRLPMAPRFPVPSHILGMNRKETDCPTTNTTHEHHQQQYNNSSSTTTTRNSWWLPPLLSGTATTIPPSPSTTTIATVPPSLDPPTLSNKVTTTTTTTIPIRWEDSPNHRRDLLEEAFSSTFIDSSRPIVIHQAATTTNTTLLWSQKYGGQTPTSSSGGTTTTTTSGSNNNSNSSLIYNTFVGEAHWEAAGTLQEWIQSWCRTRQQALDRMKKRQVHLARSTKKRKTKTTMKNNTNKKKNENYTFIDDDDDDDEDLEQLTNVYLLTGPPASGKTSLVHSVAKSCNCSVLEINTASNRNGSSLKHSIQEATRSCSTLHMFQHQQQQQKQQQQQTLVRVQQSLSDTDDDDDEEYDEKEKKTASLTVILIDEVDLIYETEGDSGFWSALASVARTARCPIFLTANTIPLGMTNIKFSHLELERPSPMDCAMKIFQVCQQEHISIIPHIDPTMVHDRLRSMASICQCDLRKLLNQLQLFASSPPHSTTSTTILPVFPRLLQTSNPSLATGNDYPRLLPGTPGRSPTETSVRPLVLAQSIVPSRVPFDKYNVVTLYGRGFLNMLVGDGHQPLLTVQMGDDEPCRVHVVDDERVLFLCPPAKGYNDGEEFDSCPSRRVRSLRLLSPYWGELDTSQGQPLLLSDGSSLPLLKRLYIEYLFPEKDEMEDSEGQKSNDEDIDVKSSSRNRQVASLEDGLELWNTTTADEPTKTLNPESRASIGRDDESTVKALEEMAQVYQYSSDAAFLEDLQNGIPLLSGTCRGFGFELTEEGSGFANDGKLRLNENSRPPPEERLYKMGWQTNCFFHGTPEAYMTQPNTASERRSLCVAMESARGEKNPKPDIVLLLDKEDETSNDLEDIVRRECITSEEDMFLSQPISPSLVDLPRILRNQNNKLTHDHWTEDEFFKKRRQIASTRFCKQLSSMFDGNLQLSRVGGRTICRDLLRLNDRLDETVTTEFLPFLRWIAVLERSRDAEYDAQQPSHRPVTGTRSTRLQTKALRKHYFDSISRKLGLSDASSTEETTNNMAQDLLRYIAIL